MILKRLLTLTLVATLAAVVASPAPAEAGLKKWWKKEVKPAAKRVVKEIDRVGNRIGKEVERGICRIPEALGAKCNVNAGVMVDSSGNVTGTDGSGNPSEKPQRNDTRGDDSAQGTGDAAERHPASTWRALKTLLKSEPLNQGEDDLIAKMHAEQAWRTFWRDRGHAEPPVPPPAPSIIRPLQGGCSAEPCIRQAPPRATLPEQRSQMDAYVRQVDKLLNGVPRTPQEALRHERRVQDGMRELGY